ncbi:MAG: GTPase HflX [Proteobacteria bacterium]|nr:GTPase HflX [Pseudomonadota bacterium]
MIEYSQEKTKVLLLAVHLKTNDFEVTLDSLREMESLATTLDFEVAGQETQARVAPDPRSYIGGGKLNEIKGFVKQNKVNLILFDHELSPNQGKYLENYLDCMVWDRTQLILEIFASHARTPESRNQVELAQLKYMLPRLVGLWAHLDREKGGISASRGTGEKQINIDRKLIRNRITRLEKSLKKVAKERTVQSKRRSGCFQVGVVGYTNAGKTSLINQLTGSDLLAEDKLFATLESTTRILHGLSNPDILVSDTVGFIRNLPHNLIASFRSTLAVVKDADVLLQVVDASSPNIEQHISTTEQVLKEIEADTVPRLVVLNKIDLVPEKMDRMILSKTYPQSVLVSIYEPEQIESLREKIKEFFARDFVRDNTLLPYDRAALLSRFYQLGTVEEIEYAEDGIHITHAISHTNKKILNSLLKS